MRTHYDQRGFALRQCLFNPVRRVADTNVRVDRQARVVRSRVAGKILQNGSVPVVLMHPAREQDALGVATSQAEVTTA